MFMPNPQRIVIPTPLLAFNWLAGGGIASGDVVSVVGETSSGRTALLLTILANAQKSNLVAAYIDCEDEFLSTMARQCGVDDNLIYAKAQSSEEALDVAKRLINSGSVDILAIDKMYSLLSSNSALDAADVFRKNLKHLANIARERHVALIFSLPYVPMPENSDAPVEWWALNIGAEDHRICLRHPRYTNDTLFCDVHIYSKYVRYQQINSSVAFVPFAYQTSWELFSLAASCTIIHCESRVYIYNTTHLATSPEQCIDILNNDKTLFEQLSNDVQIEFKNRCLKLKHRDLLL